MVRTWHAKDEYNNGYDDVITGKLNIPLNRGRYLPEPSNSLHWLFIILPRTQIVLGVVLVDIIIPLAEPCKPLPTT